MNRDYLAILGDDGFDDELESVQGMVSSCLAEVLFVVGMHTMTDKTEWMNANMIIARK